MRITAFALGLAAAAVAHQTAHAVSGAWALLTNDQVVAVEQKFIAGLEAYQSSREGKEAADKKARGEDKDNSGLLGDLDRKERQQIYGRNRKPSFQTDEERVKGSRRKLPGGEDQDLLDQRRERRKSLRELLKELNTPEDPPLQKYSKDYAKALYETFKEDPKKYAELAGEISAGEYGKVPQAVGKASAALLTKAVGDVLDAYKFETAKQIWDGFTGNIEDLQDVGSALFRGDWDKFKSSLKELGLKKAKAATEETIKRTVGFAFGPLGKIAGSTYVQVIESEIEVLKWSKRTLDRSVTTPCLDRYVQTYQRVGGPGAPDVAYDEFKMCTEERGKFVGFAALESYIVQNGLSADEIYRKLAEDYRLGNVRFVDRWFEQLVEERKQVVEAQWEKDFAVFSGRMADVSSRVNRASSIFINGIIEDVLGEAKIAELEAAAAKALLDTFRDMQMLRRAAGGVEGACDAFDAARDEAASILDSSDQTDKNAEAIEIKARQFAGCNSDATAIASLKRLFGRAQTVSQDFDRERQAAEREVDAACKAAEAVATKTSEEEGRKQLDGANERAAAAQKAIQAAQTAFTELTDLSKRAGEVKLGGDQAAREQLAALDADAELIRMGRGPLQTRLGESLARMAAALRTVQNLEGYAIDQANKIKPVLAPHRQSTLRAQVLQAEDEIKEILDDIAGCRRIIADKWTKGDGDDGAWRSQRIGTGAVGAMESALAEAGKKCPATPGEDPAATRLAIADLGARAEAEATIVALGKATVDRCLAEAGSAFLNVRNAANAVLTMQAPIVDDVKNWAGTWTMSDGSGSLQNYDGEYISKGTFTWTPPPANVGPQGFSITMTAACQTGTRQGGTAVGTGISVEGFDLVTSATDRTPPKLDNNGAPANCKTGESLSNSVTVHVMPRANYAEGDVAKIKIGAFWGPGVTYRYVAGKPKP